MADVFAGMKESPFWWEEAPRPDDPPPELPVEVDAQGGYEM